MNSIPKMWWKIMNMQKKKPSAAQQAPKIIGNPSLPLPTCSLQVYVNFWPTAAAPRPNGSLKQKEFDEQSTMSLNTNTAPPEVRQHKHLPRRR
ncbi:hypothetical protein ABVT39_014169 [Epinephelus coioides]